MERTRGAELQGIKRGRFVIDIHGFRTIERLAPFFKMQPYFLDLSKCFLDRRRTKVPPQAASQREDKEN